MQTVISADGTPIAYDRRGTGPALILVVGAFNLRATGAPLADRLAESFTTYTYDRRGRGDSGDTLPYAVGREIEDIAALVGAAGGGAALFGFSSGAVLAMRATAAGLPVTGLVMLDPPPTGPDRAGLASEIRNLVAQGRRGDAVAAFQASIGLPPHVIEQLRQQPFWPALEAVAHTLVYELAVCGEGAADLAREVPVPTLVLVAEHAAPPLHRAAHDVAVAVPGADHRVLAGIGHDLVPDVVGPVLREFLAG